MEILAVKWKKHRAPRRVLAIRLQAMGDLVITLPYLQGLRNMLPPGTRLDLLTREEVDAIPRNMNLFNRVYSIGGGRITKKQLLHTAMLLPRLLLNRYDVVIDLQDNIISRLTTKCLRPKSWSVFDRLSEIPAGERTRQTIEAIGLGTCFPAAGFNLVNRTDAMKLLQDNGWIKECKLLLLNPAGAFETRNWPLDNYTRFAGLWLKRFPRTQFLILGTSFIADKSIYLEEALGGLCINLVNKTTPAQAFAIMQEVKFVLSEDSGLMHMAWVSGVPTMALFGSTGSQKARPLGGHTAFVDSADLECGGCMLEKCKFADTRCLTRYTPELIFKKSIALLES
ncbi:MAG: glycosyltransferase family 9 protein [Bacteroidota bacterium]|nr:glycosyltransferase family 9 protein [Bacteroidota bacterium]MDP4211043.1 glycosyltransferase family 9 protein [Bacteroidota bacterium]MDP4248735.1 glycosyltransferase family 9 protein [Bacteroidota bacterium]